MQFQFILHPAKEHLVLLTDLSIFQGLQYIWVLYVTFFTVDRLFWTNLWILILTFRYICSFDINISY